MSNTNGSKQQAHVRILLVDDHPIVRTGVRLMIDERPEWAVCGEASGLTEAMLLFHETNPHLVIVDLSLESGSGLELVKELTSARPEVKILVQSIHDESLFAERCLRAGAKGYVNKEQATDQLLLAIERVLAGKVHLSDQMTERMLSRSVGQADELSERSPISTLSDRELEVFEQIGQGLTTKEIAHKLELSPKTIETYREHIKAKLKLRNATELTCRAVQWVMENS